MTNKGPGVEDASVQVSDSETVQIGRSCRTLKKRLNMKDIQRASAERWAYRVRDFR